MAREGFFFFPGGWERGVGQRGGVTKSYQGETRGGGETEVITTTIKETVEKNTSWALCLQFSLTIVFCLHLFQYKILLHIWKNDVGLKVMVQRAHGHQLAHEGFIRRPASKWSVHRFTLVPIDHWVG